MLLHMQICHQIFLNCCFIHTRPLVCKWYVIVPIQMSFSLHPQLPSLVLSSLLCLPPHPPSAHVVPLPTLPHPCRRHTDCQTPYRPYRCGRVSEAVVQSRRLLLCWRQQLRLQRQQQWTEPHIVLQELALRVSWHQDHTRREGPSPKTRWDVPAFISYHSKIQE